MHIAVLSARYTPETSPGAKRVSDLVAALQAAGHRTTVLTQLPSYPDPTAFRDYLQDARSLAARQEHAGVEVRRISPWTTAKGNLPCRLLAEARFAYLTSRFGTRLSGFDGVFATSPYILSLCSARSYSAPMWLDLRDLTWEYSRTLGPKGRLYQVGYHVMKWLALGAFRHAVRISTTTNRQRQYLTEHGICPDNIEVIPNGVPREIVDALGQLPTRAPHHGPLRLVYAGLLGFPQGLSFAIEAIEAMRDKEVEFHLYGEGVDREAILDYCTTRSLHHVRVQSQVSYQEYLKTIASADVLYASLRPGYAMEAAMPSKIFEYMAAHKPILFAGAGEAAETIRRAGAGVCIDYGDKEAFQIQLRRLMADFEYRQQCGDRGRCWVLKHHIRETINSAWVQSMADAFRSAPRKTQPSHRCAIGRKEWR